MDDTLRNCLILIPALPLAAAVIVAVLGPKILKGHSHWPAVPAPTLAVVVAALAAPTLTTLVSGLPLIGLLDSVIAMSSVPDAVGV